MANKKTTRKRTATAPAPLAAPLTPSRTCWVEVPGLFFTVLDVLDLPSLARLSQVSPTLYAAVAKWASFVAKRDWAAVPHGARVDHVKNRYTLARHAAVFPPSHLSLSCLQFLRHMGADLIEQQRYLSQPDCLEKAQCQARQQEVGEEISRGIRDGVADLMWAYTSLFDITPALTHAAVSLMDRALCFTMPASKVTLLGLCCLMIESHHAPQPIQRLSLLQVQHLTGT